MLKRKGNFWHAVEKPSAVWEEQKIWQHIGGQLFLIMRLAANIRDWKSELNYKSMFPLH